MSKKVVITLLLALFVTGGVVTVFANEIATGEPVSTTSATPTATPAEIPATTPSEPAAESDKQNTVIAERLSKAYGISVTAADVQGLRDSKYGYGEIGLAYQIASLTGKPLSEITAMRSEKKGWGVIAKSLGVDLSKAADKAADSIAASEKESKSLKDTISKEEHSSVSGVSKSKGMGSANEGKGGNSSGQGGGQGGGHGGGRGGK